MSALPFMKPFLHGRKPHDSAPLRLAPPPPAFAGRGCGATATAPDAPSAAIEVVKDGDKVVRLVVTCACGEKIEVHCLYPPGG
jgi:hypothetical protein